MRPRPPSPALCLALTAIALPGCGDSPPADAPSVVLVTIDTLRADRLGCYGYAAAETPRIDALAAGGTRFTDARTCVPITLPSHASILTGTYPPHHGIRDNGVATLGDSAVTLAELFQDRGYATGAFVSAVVLDRRYGLDQGFDVYDQVSSSRSAGGGFLEERRAAETVASATSWLAEVDRPFFLWVHLFDPHVAYDAPEPYRSRFRTEPYDGEIAYADAQLGVLLDALAAREDAPRQVVVLTSDHGESLWEHGEETHGIFVYDSCLHVPLIVSGHGAQRGRVVEAPVATVDLVPTLADLADLKPPTPVHGRSLRPWLADAAPPGGDRVIYFENYGPYLGNGWSPLVGVTNGRRKVIDSARPELYDLMQDPAEETDRYGAEAELAARLSDAARAAWGSFQNPTPPAAARSLSTDERAALEQLGYTTGVVPTGALPYPDPSFKDAKDLIQSHVALNRGMGLILQYQRNPSGNAGRLDEALAVLTHALEDDPEGAMLNEFTGIAWLLKGDPSRAAHYLRSALARRPERVSARYHLGLALRDARDIEAALVQLRRCAADDPSFAQTWRTMAEVYEKQGDLEEASRCWEQFLSSWGADDETARGARRRLLRLRDRLEGR